MTQHPTYCNEQPLDQYSPLAVKLLQVALFPQDCRWWHVVTIMRIAVRRLYWVY